MVRRCDLRYVRPAPYSPMIQAIPCMRDRQRCHQAMIAGPNTSVCILTTQKFNLRLSWTDSSLGLKHGFAPCDGGKKRLINAVY